MTFREAGRSIRQNGGAAAVRYEVSKGLAMDEESPAHKLAEQVRGRNDRLTDTELGRLSFLNGQAAAVILEEALEDRDPETAKKVEQLLKNAQTDAMDKVPLSDLEDLKERHELKVAQSRFALKDHPSPTYEDLQKKPPIKVVDLRRQMESNLAEKERVFKKSQEAKEIIQGPVRNLDTEEQIYITLGTFTHSFSGQGINKLEVARNIRSIMENAVLTHRMDSRKDSDRTTGVYTFFGAVRTEDGIHPIKLQVKEYYNAGQMIPVNVREALGDDWDTFASTYDGRVLVLDSIEKETDGKQVGLPANHRPTNTSDPSVSTVNVTDLYALVNQESGRFRGVMAAGIL